MTSRDPQVVLAAALYVAATLVFAWPPLQEGRLVLGLVLGLKAQILFMAPFTAAFSRLIGGPRVTNGLTTMLCLAPLLGAAVGTAVAPALIPYAGTPTFMLLGLPAVLALLFLLAGWWLVAGGWVVGSADAPHKLIAQAPTPPHEGSGAARGGGAAPAMPRRDTPDGCWSSLAGPPDLDSPRFEPCTLVGRAAPFAMPPATLARPNGKDTEHGAAASDGGPAA